MGVDPTAAPLPDTVFSESQGLRDLLVGLAIRRAQHDLRPLDQAVGGFAAPGESFQDGALRGGQVNQRGWTGHGLSVI